MKNVQDNIQVKRESTRWLMVFYDTIIYVLCWIITLSLFRQMHLFALLYAVIGYILFISARFLLSVYRRILRCGTVSPFARLICADAVATVVLLLLTAFSEMLFHKEAPSHLALTSASIVFVLVSIIARVLYCYIYRLAIGETKLAKAARFLLERFALVDFNSNNTGATLHLVWESKETVPTQINELQKVIENFAVRGKVTRITQINTGYINRTYKVETLSDAGHVHKYTLQRINTNVFKDVDALMENYRLVTETLYGALRIGDHQEKAAVQSLRTTKEGCSYLNDASGCWRMLTFFDDVYSLDIPDRPETFESAGYAFGSFIKAMSNVDIGIIKEIIPNFHNTKSRYEDLERSIDNHKDGRVKDVLPEIEFIRERSVKYCMISDALETGKIPRRICHNDCNLNNILFDKKTHKPVAIIDLDTVMPSSPLYDFGDSMRIGTNTAKDDEKDLSKVSCDLNMYEHYARGYLRACGDMLTKKELELLPYASLIITSEDGIRFLMDHIDGDIYYNISYPGQNLDRARTQLKLVEDMEKKLPQIKQILRNIYAEYGLKANI